MARRIELMMLLLSLLSAALPLRLGCPAVAARGSPSRYRRPGRKLFVRLPAVVVAHVGFARCSPEATRPLRRFPFLPGAFLFIRCMSDTSSSPSHRIRVRDADTEMDLGPAIVSVYYHVDLRFFPRHVVNVFCYVYWYCDTVQASWIHGSQESSARWLSSFHACYIFTHGTSKTV